MTSQIPVKRWHELIVDPTIDRRQVRIRGGNFDTDTSTRSGMNFACPSTLRTTPLRHGRGMALGWTKVRFPYRLVCVGSR